MINRSWTICESPFHKRRLPAWLAVAALATLAFTSAVGGGLLSGWITGYDRSIPLVGQPRPVLNTPFNDDVHGATIRRVSAPNEISPLWVRHEYSRRQAFNADGSRLIMMGNNGAWLLHEVGGDGAVQFVRKLPSMSEPNWHPTDPHRFRYFPRGGGLTIMEHDVVSGGDTELADFAGRLPWPAAEHVWTVGEGEPSADGRYWCLLAEDASHVTRGMFSYDLQADRIIATADLAGDPDHISTSPGGDYCVPSGNAIGGTWSYSRDLTQARLLHPKSEHSDVAIDQQGNDVLVFADYTAGWVAMADLATGERTNLVRIYEIAGSAYALHLSGNSYRRPGHVVISTYAASLDKGLTPANYGDIWGHDRLAVIELDADARIHNLAYMHNRINGYWTEPHATVDLDLTKILFVSNWESGSASELHSYLVDLAGGVGGGIDRLLADGFED